MNHSTQDVPHAPKGRRPAREPLLRTASEFLDDGTQILSIEGELDMETSPRFATALNNAIARSDRVVVDLTRCGFLDCSALNVFVKASKRLNGTGPLSLIVPDSHVLKVFKMTHLDRVFDIQPTRAAAVAHRRRAHQPDELTNESGQ